MSAAESGDAPKAAGASIEELVGETLALVEQASDAKNAAASAAISSDENLSNVVAELKDGKQNFDGFSNAPKPPAGDKLLEEMKNAFTDDTYRDMLSKIMTSETTGQSAPSQEPNPPQTSSAENDFVKNIGECMKQLKSEEESAVGGEFFSNFMKAFEGAMDNDDNFSKSMEFLMSGMLSNNVLSDSLQQIVDLLEPYLRTAQCTPHDRTRYEEQLRLYKEILALYEASPADISPEQNEVVNKKLLELQNFGPPPQEIMDKLKGTEEIPTGDDSFEDFVKNMGLGQGLGEQEQEMIKQLSSNPEELEQIMAEMAKEIKNTDKPCAQQ